MSQWIHVYLLKNINQNTFGNNYNLDSRLLLEGIEPVCWNLQGSLVTKKAGIYHTGKGFPEIKEQAFVFTWIQLDIVLNQNGSLNHSKLHWFKFVGFLKLPGNAGYEGANPIYVMGGSSKYGIWGGKVERTESHLRKQKTFGQQNAIDLVREEWTRRIEEEQDPESLLCLILLLTQHIPKWPREGTQKRTSYSPLAPSWP